MSIVETGTGEGFTARVTAQGQIEVHEVQRIVDPVTTRPEIMGVDTTSPAAVDGTSSQVVDPMEGRRCLEIQNLGDFPVNFVLAADTTPATTGHRRLAPGETWRSCGCGAYAGAVQALASGGDSPLSVMQSFTEDDL